MNVWTRGQGDTMYVSLICSSSKCKCSRNWYPGIVNSRCCEFRYRKPKQNPDSSKNSFFFLLGGSEDDAKHNLGRETRMWGSAHRSCPELAKIGGEDLAFQVNRQALVSTLLRMLQTVICVFYFTRGALKLKVWEPYYSLGTN